MADHWAHQDIEDYQSMNFKSPEKNIMLVTDCENPRSYDGPKQGSRWTMVFDEVSNALGNGVGTVIISPNGFLTPFTHRLCFECTNNMAEYEVCIFGLKVSIDLRIEFLDVYRDSTLVIIQVKGE